MEKQSGILKKCCVIPDLDIYDCIEVTSETMVKPELEGVFSLSLVFDISLFPIMRRRWNH